MALIDVRNLTFRFENSYEYVFEDVSFQIDTNWKIGLIGRNGRGKTTFLNLLQGKYEYQGTIHSTQSFSYFPFIVSDKTKTTIEVIDDIDCGYEYWMLQRELQILQVDEEVLYRPFCTLSNGEQTKVLLAALFLKENSYLLIDEPTNHLDEEARKVVSQYLKRKKNFILVCHDRTFMDECIDHIFAINKMNIEIQSGNFSSWYQNKENQDHLEMVENEKLKKDIKRLSKAAKRTADWSDKVESTKNGTRIAGLRPDRGRIGHKSAKMMRRAKNAEKRSTMAVEQKQELLKNIETSEELKLNVLKHPKQQVVSVEDISIYYDSKQVCKEVRFTIEQGERIAITGKNGSGKSSILKCIQGDDITYQGNIKKASGLVIAYVTQDTQHLHGDLKEYARTMGVDETLCKTILRKLDFSREQFDKELQTYSSGQKKKVLLASALAKPAHLYIFDEPLNFIDVFSRIQIENVLKNSQATILFVEHDVAFKNAIATKTVEL